MILLGTQHWGGLVSWLGDRFEDRRLVGPGDLRLVRVTDDVDEAAELARHCHLSRTQPPVRGG